MARQVIVRISELGFLATGGTSEVPSNALRGEDGTPILAEDGSYILVDE